MPEAVPCQQRPQRWTLFDHVDLVTVTLRFLINLINRNRGLTPKRLRRQPLLPVIIRNFDKWLLLLHQPLVLNLLFNLARNVVQRHLHVLLEFFHLENSLLRYFGPLLTGGARRLEVAVCIILIVLFPPLLGPNGVILRFQRFLNFCGEVRFQLQLLVGALALVQPIQVGCLAGGHGCRLYSL